MLKNRSVMTYRKRITEEDLNFTRSLIAGSYGTLKQSALSLPSQVLCSTERTIRRYPAGSVVMLVIAGGILYGLFRAAPRYARSGTVHDRTNAASSPDSMFRDILIRTIPFSVPYLLAFIRYGLNRVRPDVPDVHLTKENNRI